MMSTLLRIVPTLAALAVFGGILWAIGNAADIMKGLGL